MTAFQSDSYIETGLEYLNKSFVTVTVIVTMTVTVTVTVTVNVILAARPELQYFNCQRLSPVHIQ
jgi:hypothetical protein